MQNLELYNLNNDVCFGRSNGKIIWQPRIGCWIDDKVFNGGQLPTPYTGMNYLELYKNLGCSARLYVFNNCFKPVYPNTVNIIREKIDSMKTMNKIETPIGTLSEITMGNDSNSGRMPEKWWIENEDDMKKYIWLHEHTSWTFDKKMYDKYFEECCSLGAPTAFMPRVSVQNLYIDTMGMENGIFALYDFPSTVSKYFTALHESHMRMIDVINASPIDIINFGDNIHCGTLTPDIFKKYVLPYYQERTDKLHTYGKFANSHWDGDTYSLLPYAKETGLDGIEAITPKPQGDVSLEYIKEHLGDELFLLDGIPAILFDDLFPIEQLVETTEKIIELFAPKLILGISDEISSTGDIERIRIVGDIVDKYNEQFDQV
ncbi:MAG: hypothetical protein KAQ68_02455 [Clostridiales bacterium]|nr:hypothetical protein [Clostridiales bacterium]